MKIALCLCLSLIEVAGSATASDHEVLKTLKVISPSKDKFYLYTRNNAVPDEIRANNFKDLDKSHFQPEKPSFIIIANIFTNLSNSTKRNIRPALLQVKDANVFDVAYASLFSQPGSFVWNFGAMVAKFVNYIVTNYGVPTSNFNFIGYGLGAYVVAHAGNLLEGKISTMVGLDPDKGLLAIYPLNFNSSTKVIIVHTSLHGVPTNVGNIDIYFNGGRYQPECGLYEPTECARSKAYEYYARAILDLGITAITCDSYANFVKRACDNNQKVSVGSLLLDGTPPGTYYLN